MDEFLRSLQRQAISGGLEEKNRYIAALERVIGGHAIETQPVILQGPGMNVQYRLLKEMGGCCVAVRDLVDIRRRGLKNIRLNLNQLVTKGVLEKRPSLWGHNYYFAVRSAKKVDMPSVGLVSEEETI